MVSTFVFFSKSLDLLFFLQSKKYAFHSKENFPQSRNFSTVEDIFHNQGTFPQSRLDQENFLQLIIKKTLKAKFLDPFNN